ncbi:MAG TPA: hypothetical protein VGL97_21430 [Bryobacteraceae bacterium]
MRKLVAISKGWGGLYVGMRNTFVSVAAVRSSLCSSSNTHGAVGRRSSTSIFQAAHRCPQLRKSANALTLLMRYVYNQNALYGV